MPGTGKLYVGKWVAFFALSWSIEQFTVAAPFVDGPLSGKAVPWGNALANWALAVIVPRILQANAPVGRIEWMNAHCWSLAW